MTDNVEVIEGDDLVNVAEVVETITPVVSEVVIQGEGQTDALIVTEPIADAVAVAEITETIPVTETIEEITPNFSEILVQVVEDSEMPYAKRTDFVSETVIYRADAAVGSIDSDAKWRIRRLTIATDGDVTEEWAAGNASFDKIWNDRAAEVYS